MDPRSTALGSNNTGVEGGQTESYISIVLFAGIAVVLICCIPLLFGKNGPIRSREWFSRKS